MVKAVISVQFAGPLVTVQDTGRVGHMRFGVPRSGPMDRLAFAAAQAALGNAADAPAIEVSLGGISLKCTRGQVSLAIAGGNFSLDHNDQTLTGWQIITLHEGERLTVRAGPAGSWAYIAFAGRLTAQEWLGSVATHSTSGFGGGRVEAGQTLIVNDAEVRPDRLGDIPEPEQKDTGPIRVVMGPQDALFLPEARAQLLDSGYTLSDAYDRMGVRLTGPSLPLGDAALSIPSEPIVRGCIQVSGDGVPTVLLADHQTTGGYPKIATVISADINRLVQMRAGQTLRFAAIPPEDAVLAARAAATAETAYLEKIAVARGTFEQRLMRENLIHGAQWDM